jgi:hypothetical protein
MRKKYIDKENVADEIWQYQKEKLRKKQNA